ncbi:MAG: hypothetical protein QOC95_1684, partial [Thermoleophilaceae bacterium]|nr:hypothetical protein [Thermoleophilaceae bacterium]
LAFHRGGNGYADDSNVKYGELAAADLAGPLPAPVPSSGGRGAACNLTDEPAYRVQVRSIPGAMHYKRPQDLPSGSNAGSSFEHYGDPGADQGARRDIHYSYLLWSFLDVRGGGMVRTLLAPDQVVRPCDVQPITLTSWDRAGAANGSVTARYVRVLAGTCPLYGWMVWEHTYLAHSQSPVAHAIALPGSPPGDPAPDPACPAAAAASPPAVQTSAGTAAGDGSATISGTVNPAGADSGYRFDYGPGPDYGASTPATVLLAADRAVPVTAALTGLEPGFALHYRLVAWSVHGTSFGRDRTLALPVGAIRADAVASRPTVRNLRVAPRAFGRARSRHAATARIRYRLSARAKLTLTFQRRAVGVRRARACRRPGSGGIARHARRCARWMAVRGSLRVAAAGSGRVRFGGWIGSRPLPSGSYRVRAVPAGGRARLARFVLRPVRGG